MQAAGMDVKAQKDLESRMKLAEQEAQELRENQTLLHEERRKLKALANYHKSGSFSKKKKKRNKANKTEFQQTRGSSDLSITAAIKE